MVGLLERIDTRPTEYSTQELIERAGISYRQADYWCRSGIISPSIRNCDGSGTQRVWSAVDVKIASLLGQLSAAGYTRLRDVGVELDSLRDSLADFVGWAVVSTDGSVHLVDRCEDVAAFVAVATALAHIVPVQ